jgi:uncharacterized protein (DUF885 family)
MTHRRRQAFILACLLSAASPALAGPTEDFTAVQRDYEAMLLDNSPEYASALGVSGHEGAVSDLSLAGADREAAASAALLARLDAIAATSLTGDDQVNRAIMHRQLTMAVAENRFGQRAINFSTYSGWHQGFAGLADDSPFNNRADYRSYLDRLARYPTFNTQALATARTALAGGYVLPCEVLGGHERSITGLVTATPEASRYYAPFIRTRPVDISAADWTEMQDEAKRTIISAIFPALRAHRDFFVNEYLPRCATAPGISAQPGGADWYQHRIRVETTTDLTAAQIHQIGLDEVARIRAEMTALATRSGYPTREAMIAHMRSDPSYFTRSPEELLMRTALTNKRVEGWLPRLFGRLPRLPFTLRAIPAETAEGTTTAYYSQGSPSAGIAGTYYVNTSLLNQRPIWEIPALSLHESVPGHHLQIALQQELDLPRWRRDFVSYTAFVEGWGLYAERLGIEMGLYDTPEADMGRLSYEMWRACRLVVDTGIHAQGWTKARAIAFMRDNSALTDANIEAEVNRYISWPGQALGYKLGELRIRALRTRAETALGTRFDLRAFHDEVLGAGPLPLDVLEARIDAWIMARR